MGIKSLGRKVVHKVTHPHLRGSMGKLRKRYPWLFLLLMAIGAFVLVCGFAVGMGETVKAVYGLGLEQILARLLRGGGENLSEVANTVESEL